LIGTARPLGERGGHAHAAVFYGDGPGVGRPASWFAQHRWLLPLLLVVWRHDVSRSSCFRIRAAACAPPRALLARFGEPYRGPETSGDRDRCREFRHLRSIS